MTFRHNAAMTSKELRAARAALGMTGDQLAATLGVTGRTYRRWELDETPVPAIAALAVRLLLLTDPERWPGHDG